MGACTTYCLISGCTPQVATTLSDLEDTEYGPIVTRALEALADQHELSSQDDISLIGPIHPSGEPYEDNWNPETDIRVLPHCVMGEGFVDCGEVEPPPALKKDWEYTVGLGSTLMVQTFALDILALATHGRMTPLRLWQLAMKQELDDGTLDGFKRVKYGKIAKQWQQELDEFPGFKKRLLSRLEKIGDVEVAKQQLMFDGLLWLWIAPDRFPISPSEDELPLWLPEVEPSTLKNLPAEVFMRTVSFLPPKSLLNLAGTSRSLRTGILGDDYLARIWMYNNAPWWIPVPTQTPKKAETKPKKSQKTPPAGPSSEWSAHIPLTTDFPAELGWAYIWRCMRSGSMQNRKRIWHLALDIEHVANFEKV